jgi:hypothetical protein
VYERSRLFDLCQPARLGQQAIIDVECRFHMYGSSPRRVGEFEGFLPDSRDGRPDFEVCVTA